VAQRSKSVRTLSVLTAVIVLFVALCGFAALANQRPPETQATDTSDTAAAESTAMPAETSKGTAASEAADTGETAAQASTTTESAQTPEPTQPPTAEKRYIASFASGLLDLSFAVLESGRVESFPQRYVSFTDDAKYFEVFISSGQGCRLIRRDNTTGKETVISKASSQWYTFSPDGEWLYYVEREDDFLFGDDSIGMRFRFYQYHIETGKRELLHSFIGGLWSVAYYEGALYCGVRLDDVPNESGAMKQLIRIDIAGKEAATLITDPSEFEPYVADGQLYLYRFLYSTNEGIDLPQHIHTIERVDTDGKLLQTMLKVEGDDISPSSTPQHVNGLIYVTERSTGVYAVNPTQPGKLISIYQMQNKGCDLHLMGATDTHLYISEAEIAVGEDIPAVYLYSYALDSGKTRLEWTTEQ